MPQWDVLWWEVPSTYAVRGHVSTERFIDAVRGYCHLEDTQPVTLDGAAAHEWIRFIPGGDTFQGGAYMIAAPGRGASRVTIGTIAGGDL
jgi:hypothetical protein